MTVGRQRVMVRLTPAQALRMERMGETLWPSDERSRGYPASGFDAVVVVGE